jgi:hypothetical protein
MDFNTYKDGVRAAEITARHITHMQEDGHLRWCIGFVEFRALKTPVAGQMVVYRTGETAFVMNKPDFERMHT